jgi:general L-amino acid transport system permease protein
MTGTLAYVRTEDAPRLPPPGRVSGPAAWVMRNLFATPLGSLATVVLGALSVYIIWTLFSWAVIDAVWTGADREACAIEGAGACWPFIKAKFGQWVYGLYPISQRWRVDICLVVGLLALIPLLMPSAPYKLWNILFLLVVYPIMTFILLGGGVFGLMPIDTASWGGLTLTLVIAVTGIVASFPLGILLALGRQSKMPVVSLLSTVFIEVVRGVPLITVLFIATAMFPLFLPPGWKFDELLMALIGVALFSAAYMAEVVRGGLQAIPRGQHEAAKALGLSYWKIMALIVLPQALKIVIPGIVNSFISLFKDTTLVTTIGLFDLLGIVQLGFQDPKWASPQTPNTSYFTLAILYWLFCFGMSRYSIYTERRLNTGHKR